MLGWRHFSPRKDHHVILRWLINSSLYLTSLSIRRISVERCLMPSANSITALVITLSLVTYLCAWPSGR
ncbi:hypothetical protein NOF04DRAFT_1327502 [Fusarium oxysporum II5]|nr:hypothetical protein NOF04DRAFT_1327502 [Fusarium oxysporum II5]